MPRRHRNFSFPLESPLPDFDLGQAISRSELKVEEVRAWAKDGLEILKQTRAEHRSHLPEFTVDSASVETYVSARLHDLSGASNLKLVTSHLPELPRIPRAEQYLCNLSDRLKSLHSHLSSSNALSHVAFPSFPSIAKLSEHIDTIISSDRFPVMLRARSMSRSGDPLGRAATEVARAIERSVHGAKLITYSLRNGGITPLSPTDIGSYLTCASGQSLMGTCPLSFIPLSRWPVIVASIFALHNETRMCSFHSEYPVVADVFILLSKHPHASYPLFVMD